MKVLYVSAEVAPLAKVGGLADVAGSLPKALRLLGHDVRIAMPGYAMASAERDATTLTDDLSVQINPDWLESDLLQELELDGVPVYLIGGGKWFSEATSSEKIYSPGIDPYLYFSHAVLEACRHLGWQPDVVHCNDWHTGLIPALMRERYGLDAASVFSIHNLAYQGEFEPELVARAGLPSYLFDMHRLETYGRLNFLKAGCVYADQVNTVSPTYAEEIQHPEYGCRLEGLMSHLAEQGRLRGILNGIDTEEFDPARDPNLPFKFDSNDPSGKIPCRFELLKRLNLHETQGPVYGIVSRLSSQKGIDLVLEIAPELVSDGGVLVVQGLGDPGLASRMRCLEAEYPGRVRLVERFDEGLARLVYAGSDFFLMPSAYEPCGLGQMIAHRYGTVPVVRNTGGLADTISEPESGFCFRDSTPQALLAACRRARAAFSAPERDATVRKVMQIDHGWGRSAKAYGQMYDDALTARRRSLAS